VSHRFRVPSSCAVTMSSSRLHHAATVAFEPVGLIVNCGSFDSARGRAARCVSVRSRVGQQCAREEEGRTVLEVVAVDGKDRDAAGEAHALLGDGEDALVVLAPRDALNGRRELPRVQALARLDVPQLHHVVRRARDEQGRGGCARERSRSEGQPWVLASSPKRATACAHYQLALERRKGDALSTSTVQTVPLWPS